MLSFTEEHSNPSFVDEGNNITLHWIYNTDGAFREGQFSLLPSTTIALKDNSRLTAAPAYLSCVQEVINESEATITLLAVSRSDYGDYQYTIENTALEFKQSVVKIFVRCK